MNQRKNLLEINKKQIIEYNKVINDLTNKINTFEKNELAKK